MVGKLDRRKELSTAAAEKVAEELGLLLELKEERRLAAARKTDLDFWLRIKRLLSEQQGANMILGQLMESCTRGESTGGVGAAFALVGEWKRGVADNGNAEAASVHQILIRAQSGDAVWSYGIEGGPLDAVWRQAIRTGRVACADAGSLPLARKYRNWWRFLSSSATKVRACYW
jgi:hypothetical protein